MKKILLSFAVTFLFAAAAVAQDITVSGVVTSAEDATPLPGVNVVVKGSTSGTVTDVDGRYTLTAPSTGTLVFSFIGLTSKEVAISNQSRIDVTMAQDVKQLTEVVVTALGIERNKNELPYAAQEVRGEDVVATRQNNFVSALSGKVAGLDIRQNNNMGGSTNVIIRGYKSISNNNQALFVIDGIPVSNANNNSTAQRNGQSGYDYGNAASDINPENIASINVLKGAAATALYGSRAANGVVVITTKKGRKNTMDVVVNSGVTWGSIDKKTFAEYQKEYGQGYVSTFTKADLGSGLADVVNFPADASFGPAFDPNLQVYGWDAVDPNHPNYGKTRPWVAAANGPDTYYETAVSSNQSIALSGGGDKATFSFSYTRTDDKGVLPNSTLDKDLFSVGVGYDVTDRLKVNVVGNYSHIKGLGRFGTGYAGVNPNQAFRQWWATNVDIKEQRAAYFANRQNITWNWNSARTAAIYMDNPYWTRYENYNNDWRDNLFGYVSAQYKLTDWLDVVGRAAINTTSEIQEERIAVGSVAVANYTRFNRTFTESNYDLMLNVNKDLSDDFNLKGLIGANLRRSAMTSIRAATNGGLAVPKLYSLTNSRNPMIPPVEEYERIGVDGIFASATLGYKNYLFLDVAGRQDKSTTLPTDNNSYFYPMGGISFVFSNVVEFPWLSNGKFTANYAEVGNDAPPLSVNDVYAKPTAIGTTHLFSLQDRKANNQLKSERTSNLEIGLQADFLDGRVGFDFAWYKSNTYDQIIPVALSTATGYSARWINSGEVENKGIEVSAFIVPVRSRDFTWTMNINYSRNRNKVLELYTEGDQEVLNVPILQPQGGVSLNAAVGHPYGVIRGTDFVYTNGQKTVNSQGHYIASASSAEIIGDPNPDWIAGIGNSFKYKGVSLNFLVDMRMGGDIWSLDMWYGDGSGLYPETAGLNELGVPKRTPVSENGGVLFPGVKEDGTPNDIRAENFNGSGATAYGYVANGQRGMPRAAYIYDASYVKLRELSLTYSIPASVIENVKFLKGIDVSLIGRNLAILHKNLPYADPEESLSSGNGNQGYQSGAYPMVRNYGFNVRFRM